MLLNDSIPDYLPRSVFECLLPDEIVVITKYAEFLLHQRSVESVAEGQVPHDEQVLIRGKGQLQIFLDRSLVLCRGRLVRLAPKAHRMLLLLGQSNITVSHDYLRRSLWPDVDVTSRAMAVHISTLRRLLEVDPRSPQLIITIHCEGYYLTR